jgi:chromate reductase
LVFGASNSSKSINKALAEYVAGLLQNVEVEVLDLNDFEMPIFSIDREEQNGIHPLANEFKEKLKWADGFIVSFAEHNGAFTAAYKNIFDWVSRIEKSFWGDKPMLLLATSPGGRGARSVLDMAYKRYNFTNKNDIQQFSLPSFYENFTKENGIVKDELKIELMAQLGAFEKAINQ